MTAFNRYDARRSRFRGIDGGRAVGSARIDVANARPRWRMTVRQRNLARMTDPSASSAPTRLTARALIIGERIETAGLERPDMISALPLAFRVGAGGMVALFRFGVAVLVGLSPLEEEDVLAKLKQRSTRRAGAGRRRDGDP